MDLLGSILDTMEKPPQTNTKQEAAIKKQHENLKKMQEMEKDRLKRFRLGIESKLVAFINNVEAEKVEFEAMEKLYRTIIHDIADKHDLVAYSFGIDGVDRHSIVYKRDTKPSDDELDTLRKGDDVYDRKLRELQDQMQEKSDNGESAKKATSSKGTSSAPASNYALKYASIIGLDAGHAAAKATTPNLQFGMVPSSNKRDLRSIEQILNDNKMKKMKNQ